MSSDNQVTLKIDGKEVTVDRGTPLIEACKQIGTEIPHFCYHKRLSVPANCRMCMVEVKGAPKPMPSCYTQAQPDMEVFTQSDVAQNAQKGAMEFLLINHPLDCPICDQGGMCDLQDMAVAYGSDRSRYIDAKRAVPDKNLGPLIRTVMTRCIHCTRCIRFATEVAGVPEMGATGRGEDMEVGTYVERALESELSGNMIDLCPVGALCSKPYSFTARPWELQHTDSIDIMDGLGSHIRVFHRGGRVMRIDPTECDHINEEWLSDAGRFSYDGLNRHRIETPYIRKGKKLEAVGWPKAFEIVTKLAKGAKATATAGLAGDSFSAEDLYSFNAFMKQTLKTDNVDARTDESTITGGGERCKYTFASTIAGIDKADYILLVGANPRLEAPVLNARIRKNVVAGRTEVASVGACVDLTYDVHSASNTAKTVAAIAAGEDKIAKKLKKAKNPMIIVGAKAVLTRKDAPQIMRLLHQISEDNEVVGKKWNGFNVLHQKPGRVAALDLCVYPEKKGKDTAAIKKAIKDSKLDLLVLYGEPDVPVADLEKAKKIIFIGTNHGAYADIADVVLPVAAYTEKSALWTNTEGRVQEGLRAVPAPMQAKEDWKIFRALSEQIAKPLPFDTQAQLRTLITEQAPHFGQVGEVAPVKWQSFGRAGEVKDEPFSDPVKQFYKNNEIMRASQVMTECQDIANARREANLQQNTNQKKAG